MLPRRRARVLAAQLRQDCAQSGGPPSGEYRAIHTSVRPQHPRRDPRYEEPALEAMVELAQRSAGRRESIRPLCCNYNVPGIKPCPAHIGRPIRRDRVAPRHPVSREPARHNGSHFVVHGTVHLLPVNKWYQVAVRRGLLLLGRDQIFHAKFYPTPPPPGPVLTFEMPRVMPRRCRTGQALVSYEHARLNYRARCRTRYRDRERAGQKFSIADVSAPSRQGGVPSYPRNRYANEAGAFRVGIARPTLAPVPETAGDGAGNEVSADMLSRCASALWYARDSATHL